MASPAEYSPDLGLFDLFKRAAVARPEALALAADDVRLSYTELLARAESVACRLMKVGVQPGDTVGIVSGRSCEAVIALLGILRAGAGYLPLDPTYAREQLDYMVSDAKPTALIHTALTEALAQTLADGRPVLAVAGQPAPLAFDWPPSSGGDLAYVIYTSGSTGKPKGVEVPQRGLARMALQQPDFQVTPEDTMLHNSTFGCDGCMMEIWGALLNGATLAVLETPKPALDLIATALSTHKATVTIFYTGIFQLMAERRPEALSGLRLLGVGGDVMPPRLAAEVVRRHSGLTLVNLYGPTENTVIGAIHPITEADLDGGPIPIGRAAAHDEVLVLDEARHEVAPGELGQLALSGPGVAFGYRGKPQQTAERFVADPRPEHGGKVYLTGDLVRQRPDGVLVFHGRADRQVKLGGRRIELDEVEHVLRQQSLVAEGVVDVIRAPNGDRRIVGFITLDQNCVLPPREAVTAIQEGMAAILPAAMVPGQIEVLPDLPLTAANKIDRKALVAQFEDRRVTKTEAVVGLGLRDRIAEIWNRVLVCGPIPADRTFFDMGGTSLQLIDVHGMLEQEIGRRFDIALLFETPRLGDLARRLSSIAADGPTPEILRTAAHADNAIAIVGMAGRFPGAPSVADLWRHVQAGTSLIPRFTEDELEDAFTSAQRSDKTYVPARPFLEGADQFDARYFEMYPKEAAATDPQARVFLEICVEALEHSGTDPARYAGAIGVFAGSSFSTYLVNNVLGDRATSEAFASGYQVGMFTEVVGNIADTLATRVAFKLNLHGPAMTVSTACSTSLVAIAQACQSLRCGQADMALAGGVSITFPQKRGYFCTEGGMVSPEGICRPFDAKAGGTVFGHGAGVVVLKRLADALADGNTIHAVIRGVGINNDGRDKISFTAPSVTGQAAAIQMAHRDAGTTTQAIGYVECHGTATPLGDPVEVRGLAVAFEGSGSGPVALGSVKGNIGHLDAAAGVTSVIKTAMVLREGLIPPMANFSEPNPRIPFADLPFHVPTQLTRWTSQSPRLAGVSSFGVGGTNVHLVLEQPPELGLGPEVRTPQILPLSARSATALATMQERLADRLMAGAITLADTAFTLQEGRTVHDHRMAIAATTVAEAIASLRKSPALKPPRSDAPPVVMMFPGQGSQYPGMGSGLYAAEPVFRHWIDMGAEILRPLLGLDINKLLCFGDPSDDDMARALRDTRLTQPALFLTQFATAKLWSERGIRPAAMIGHSVGEFAAAAVSGTLSFEDALRIIAARGQLMQDMPLGAMLSVRADLETVLPLLVPGVDIAARNAPMLNVLAGSIDAISAMEPSLTAAGLAWSRLHTSHAFHSAMMDPVSAALAVEMAGMSLKAGDIPWVSCVTGEWITPDQATDPGYWAGQARATVNFDAAIRVVARDSQLPVLLEVGAGSTLSAFAAQSLARTAHGGIVQSLPDHRRAVSDELAMAEALARLWSASVSVDWNRAGARGTRRIPLPSYPFERRRHWIDAPPVGAVNALPAAPIAEPAPSTEGRPAMTPTTFARSTRLTADLIALLTDLSGEELGVDQAESSFLELGFDSLFLGQVAQRLTRDYAVDLTFRQLLSDYPTVAALATYLDAVLPADPVVQPATAPTPAPSASVPASQPLPAQMQRGEGLADLMHSQMQTMQAVFAEQLRVLGAVPQAAATQPIPISGTSVPSPTVTARQAAPAVVASVTPRASTAEIETPAPLRFGRGPDLSGGRFDAKQQAFVDDLAARYSRKHAGSKAHTAQHRAVHADPRTAAGFRQEWKELVFPIVVERAKGSRLWDIDGNEFIDLVNGFGQTAFGHSPDFVVEAVRRQLDKGFPIGPQAERAGPVAEKFARIVRHERVTFCNTGSEAVMAAMRLARAVTGREQIVVFGNDYHGQFDEVLVKGRTRGGDPVALPIAPGIPRSGLCNMVVLPYGADESLDWMRANAGNVAAVIVEPVQSRHPEIRPADFVREVRRITAQHGAAMVMDEVVTGFRTHKRGMQGVWGIEPDMATYGKVPGGGMPVGVLAGSRRFMDALDGGAWSYEDDSKPETAPTFFAGTFVRHPLVVAAVDAVLDHIEAEGDALWVDTAERTAALSSRLNATLLRRGLPELVTSYSSWFAPNISQHEPKASLAYALMRMQGIHIVDGYCGFLTTAHTDQDSDRIFEAFDNAIEELQSVGILGGASASAALPRQTANIPLTEAQREIWMTSQLGDAASCSFNEGASVHLDGELNVEALRASLTEIVARHDALRLVFARSGESFDVAAPKPVALEVIDLEVAGSDAADAILRTEAETAFDLISGPPIRFRLLRNAANRHTLIVTAHHIVCDGWSYNVIFSDLAALYSARVEGRAPALAPAPSFAAHALSKRRENPEAEKHWRGEYQTVPALPDLPGDRPHPAIKSFNGGTVTAHIDADRLKAARKAGGKQGCTLFSTLFGALQITLARLSGSDDVVLAVPTGGQALLPDPALVGHCVNFLPIRAPMAPGASVAQHLKLVRDKVLAALDHQNFTYGTLVRELNIGRSLNRLPLTEVQFNLEKVADGFALSGLTASTHPNPKAAVNFDLFFNMIEGKDGLRIDVDYNADVYDPATVRRWIGHFATVLDSLADADQPASNVPLSAEVPQGLAATTIKPPVAETLHGLVAAIAAKHPDSLAVSFAGRNLSYAELEARSDALASRLLVAVPQRGRVAVALDRSEHLPVALLAVLKAGHAFVPLDPRHPDARLRQILETADVQAMIRATDTLPGYAEGLGIAPISLEGTADKPFVMPETNAADSAYVIFTSGSTGAPKGVEVPHRAVVNLLASMAQEPGFTMTDRLLSVTTVSFDIAILELFLPLIVGGSVVIAATEDVLDGFRLAERLQQGDITVMQATPTLWSMLLEAGLKPAKGLKIMAGGEPLPQDVAQKLLSGGAELWNLYGPTETTIWSAVSRILPDQPITIGHPVAHTALHVLSPTDEPLPFGVIGELNIGGLGLAKGYFRRDDLTRQAYREVSIGGTVQRLYRTGDSARRLADGSIEVLGRADGQIKLRGFRIELGEIEQALRAVEGVAQAAVDLRANPRGERQLVAYLVPQPGADPSPETLMRALEQQLPNYMIPARWVTLTSMPLTLNGKLDRKALPVPDAGNVTPLREATLPETPLEEQLAKIWGDVLGLETISTTESIYALGADSLTVFRIAARMLDSGLNLEARDLLNHPTVKDLARYASSRDTSAPSTRPSLRSFRHGARRDGVAAS